MSNLSINVQTAIAHLNASETEGGEWIYRDDATRLDYLADEDALEDLGVRLNRGDADAYSFWCSATDAREVEALGDWSVGQSVEGGDNAEDYDTGEVIAVRRAGLDDVEVQIAWSNGARTWQTTDGLRDVGTTVYEA